MDPEEIWDEMTATKLTYDQALLEFEHELDILRATCGLSRSLMEDAEYAIGINDESFMAYFPDAGEIYVWSDIDCWDIHRSLKEGN